MSEKKEDCEARALIALAVGVGFGVIIGAAALAAAYPVFQSEQWALWAQALGTIAAVFSGFLLTAYQRNLKERQRLDLILSVLREIHRQLRSRSELKTESFAEGGGSQVKYGVFDIERMKFCVQYLNQFGFSEFPFGTADSLREVLKEINGAVQRYEEHCSQEGGVVFSYTGFGGAGSFELKAIEQAIREIEKRKRIFL